MEPPTEVKRKWIILEDYPSKAEYLIAYILLHHPSDEIHWIFPDSTDFNRPTYVRSRKGQDILKPFSMPLRLGEGKVQVITGDIYFHWCKDEDSFLRTFDTVALVGDNILLLDVELKGLGGVKLDLLADKGKSLLARENAKSLITIMSRVANFMAVKEKIKPKEDRVLALGGRWQFIYSSLPDDCQDVIRESDRQWIKLFEQSKFTLNVFLEKMAQLNQHQCHNWQDEMPDKLEYYIQEGRWDTEWKMPVQLAYLIKLLNYDPDQFVKDLDIKKGNGYFKDGSPICHALKLMGTNDKDTHSFSLLGTAFICWSAYRHTFKEGKGNFLFINAIKTCSEKAARRKFMTPPQLLETLQDTIRQLYSMMQTLLFSTDPNATDPDNLMEVELDDTGLSICLRIDPEKLHEATAREYRKRLKGAKEIGGGTSAKKIIDYFVKSNYCDRMLMDKKPNLGAIYGLKVYAAGENVENGVILKFGNEI